MPGRVRPQLQCGHPSPRTGRPCKLAATHVHDGRPACRWHGDPARAAAHRRRHARFCWDEARVEALYGLVERGWDDARIGRELGCTAAAVKLACRRHGVPSRARLILSARDVAELLGKRCAKSVVRWIGQGWLRGKRAYRQGPNRTWLVRWADLEAFVADPAHWHRWDPARVTHPALVRAARRPPSARFLTLGECARIAGVEAGTVRQWTEKGWLPFATDGNRLVRQDWLDEFRRHWSYGDGYRGLPPAERDEVSARLASAAAFAGAAD